MLPLVDLIMPLFNPFETSLYFSDTKKLSHFSADSSTIFSEKHKL
jgi:hypothetical protein